MKYYHKIINCLFLTFLITGCTSRENLQISQNFFSKSNTILITQLSGLEEPHFYKEGPQGVADFVINEAMTESLQERVKAIKANDTLDEYYYKRFGNLLEARYLKLKEIKNPIAKKSLQDSPIDDDKYAPYDFRFLRDKYKVDYALVLDPRAFGVTRAYYGFIPISEPKGYADLSIYLINLSDNSIVGEYKASIKEQVLGEWDTPPNYVEVVTTAKAALAKALSDASIFFFR